MHAVSARRAAVAGVSVAPCRRAAKRRRKLSGRPAVARSAVVLMLSGCAAFVLIPLIPVVGLLLTPTRTDAELVHANPLAFGSLHQVGIVWHNLVTFENATVTTWPRNSAVYACGALAITLVTAIPPVMAWR